MTDLHDLLDRATDRVEATGLAPAALAAAGRRRRDRRAVLASAAAVLVVVGGVAVAGQIGDEPSPEPMPGPTPTRIAEPDSAPWNPRNVDDLPAAPDDLMAVLPRDLEVPTSTPSLAEDPVAAAVLTVGTSDAVKVLGVDGVWRHVYLPEPAGGSVELSPDGTRLLVQTADGVDLWDVTTGGRSSLPAPSEAISEIGWHWLADGTLVVFDLGRAWEVDPATGEARRMPGRDDLWDVVNGDAVAEVALPAAGETLTVTVSGREDGEVRERLPVRDSRATYANGGLSVQALLDDGTVLLRVLVQGRDAASVRFVAWDPRSGDLSLVMRTTDVLPAWSVATDLLDRP